MLPTPCLHTIENKISTAFVLFSDGDILLLLPEVGSPVALGVYRNIGGGGVCCRIRSSLEVTNGLPNGLHSSSYPSFQEHKLCVELLKHTGDFKIKCKWLEEPARISPGTPQHLISSVTIL